VTRITLQDGKVVLRDGKVGTEQACCCGDECPFQFLSCANSPATEEGRDFDIASLQQEIQDADLLSEIENAGYANARILIFLDTVGFGYVLDVVGDCCGEIDLEAEPTVVELGFFVSILCNPGFQVEIYPCNPLP